MRGLPPSGAQDEGLVLVEKAGGSLRIGACDGAALARGARLGMALGELRAILPDLEVGEMDRQGDAELLMACALACERFTPLLALDGPDGLILDITGCAHLFGGEEGLRDAILRLMARAGLKPLLSVAGTPDAARAFCRFGQGGIVRPGGEEALARALPVAALGQPPGVALALRRAGLRRLADLADRPSAMLSARFGEDIADRLRRVLGREDVRITPLRPPPDCIAERHFPEPVLDLESLMGALERLCREIVGLLERRGEGGRGFEASLFRVDGAVRRLTVETAQGTRDAASLMRLFRLRFEALADPIDPGFGFDALRLAVSRAEALAEGQPGLDGSGAAPEAGDGAVAGLVDRLAARFGRLSVMRLVGLDSHDPDRAGDVAPCLSLPSAAALPAAWPLPEAGEPPARPLMLFRKPQPIEVMAEVPDAPPLRFRWRRALHEVVRAEGPERIAPEWWRRDAASPARDYYRIEDAAGRRFWVFREGAYDDPEARPRWFVHGLFA